MIPSPTASPELIAKQAVPDAQITSMVDVQHPAAFDGLSLPTECGEYFSASGEYAIFHTKQIDEIGNDLSIDNF